MFDEGRVVPRGLVERGRRAMPRGLVAAGSPIRQAQGRLSGDAGMAEGWALRPGSGLTQGSDGLRARLSVSGLASQWQG